MYLEQILDKNNWDGIRRNFQKIESNLFGPAAIPTYSGLTLTGLTASRLMASDANKALVSTDLNSWVAGTANEIDITDDGDGSITIGIVNPLIVAKGGTGAASLTDHGILLGSGTGAITPLGVAANGKIPIGSAGADPVLAEITGTANQITSTPGAGSITLSTPQDIHTGASPTFAGATIDSIVFGDIYDAQEEPTGFVDRVATLSWNDGDQTLTITGSHDIYIYGVKTTKGTDSIQIADTTNLHWIYYDAAGTLTSSTTHPGWGLPILATVYWNTDGGGGSYNKGLAGDERHGLVMDWTTHEYLHNTVGSRYESGLAGTFNNTTLSIATGAWHDEDIEHILASPETTCNVLYKNGSAAWEWDAGASVYYKLNGTALRYNNGNSLADCTPNRYMAMWIFATNDISTPIVALMGQRQDTTLKNAQANNTYESLSFGELPFWEMKILYRVILRSTGSPPTYTETLDLRAVSNLPAGTYIATDHAVLTGLTNDDHTQYLLADGTRALAGAWNMGNQALTNVNIDSGDINVAVVNTEWDAAYSHSLLSSGNPHSVTPTELSLVIGTNTQAWDAGLDNLAALSYVSDSFIKVTATDTYAIRTITETKTDLSLNNVSNVATDDTAYNATSWNANTDAATKNAIRDKVETLDTAIGLNTTHRSSDGSDHSFIDQSVVISGSPTFANASLGTGELTCGSIKRVSGTLSLSSDGSTYGIDIYSNGIALFASDGAKLEVQATNILHHVKINMNGNDIDLVGTIQSTDIELGHASDTTITRATAGNLNIEGKLIYRADGTDVPIVDGGSGQSTAQTAINALSAVSGATNEHILTKDTGTGNAIFKAPAAHTHDGDALQLDSINSNGGQFDFNTSGKVKFTNEILLDSSNTLFTNRANAVLALQSQSSGRSMGFEVYTKDADGTDSCTFSCFAKGTPVNITNAELLQAGWASSLGYFIIWARAYGTGVARDLAIGTDNYGAQVYLDASNGRVGINDNTPGEILDVAGNINVTGVYKVDDVQVVSNQQVHIVDSTTQDLTGTDTIHQANLESDLAGIVSDINSILTALETHGLLAST